MKIQIPNTTLTIEIERILANASNPVDQIFVEIRDESIKAPEFNAITFLEDLSYNVVKSEYIAI